MLDALTLRVALAVIAGTLLVLSYTIIYRRSRSSYSAWWILSLVATAGGSALYVFDGTAIQVVSVPVANAVAVTAGTFAWAAARSLRGEPMPWAWGLVAPVATLVASLASSPAQDVWAGSAVMFAGLALMLSLAAHDLRAVRHDYVRHGGRDTSREADYSVAALSQTVATLAGFYIVRSVLFVTVGPEHALFTAVAGTVTATLAVTVTLVVVTFTMNELSQIERMRELHHQASRDSLTGLWNRRAFMIRAGERLADGSGHAVVVADLDHFKALNDRHGHEAGDDALREFARAIDRALAPGDLAGRLGGEEFALILTTDDPDIARARAEALSAEYASAAGALGMGHPTVSYGIAMAAGDGDLPSALRRADAAMYRAKRDGRDRAVVDGRA